MPAIVYNAAADSYSVSIGREEMDRACAVGDAVRDAAPSSGGYRVPWLDEAKAPAAELKAAGRYAHIPQKKENPMAQTLSAQALSQCGSIHDGLPDKPERPIKQRIKALRREIKRLQREDKAQREAQAERDAHREQQKADRELALKALRKAAEGPGTERVEAAQKLLNHYYNPY